MFKVDDRVKLEEWDKFFTIIATDGYGKIELFDGTGKSWWYDTNVLDFIKEEVEVEKSVESVNSFKVGDIVWCLIWGKGEVTDVNLQDKRYCVKVKFQLTSEVYTEDGKLYEESNRTLFFSEPKVEGSVTRPFVPTLVGKTVVIKPKNTNELSRPFLVDRETEDRLLDSHDFYWKKEDIEAIYEVSSENLLKS